MLLKNVKVKYRCQYLLGHMLSNNIKVNITGEHPQDAPIISILMPTRGRTTVLQRSLDSLYQKASIPERHELLLAMDRDDTETLAYVEQHIIPRYPNVKLHLYNRMGYRKLNLYANSLASLSQGYWLMFWTDDALMETQGWDTIVDQHRSHPMPLLRAPASNFEHPFALWPIVKRQWYELLGTLSSYSHIDRFIYNVSQNTFSGAIVNIPVFVTHDRADITGNNRDETYEQAFANYNEGNPEDPFNDDYPAQLISMLHAANKIRHFINTNYGASLPLTDLTKPLNIRVEQANSHAPGA